MKMKLSDYVADFLVKNGIDTMFMITGGGAMHLDDSLGHKEGLHCVYNHNEQGCSVAAEGYTRLTGKLAAVCVTSGPGGTNAITGVLGGWLDSIPMFILSGQVKRETTTWSTDVPIRQLGDQEYQIVKSVEPMTKYAVMVTEANEIAYHLEKALYLSKAGRGGPVWLDIPLDIQAAPIETEELLHFDPKECEKDEEPPKVETAAAEEIIKRIKAAKRPLILAGTGIRLGKAHDEFIRLIDKLQIPVVTAWNAHDVLWDEHPLYVGRPSTVGNRGGNFAVGNADLVLTLGCRLNIRQISYNYKDWAKNAYKIVVDIDKNELNKPTIAPDMKVHADVKDLMGKLLEVSYDGTTQEQKEGLAFCRKTNEKYPTVLPEYYESKQLNPYVFLRKLSEAWKEGDVVVTGNGSACVITFQTAEIKKNQRLFTNSGCASMGYGLPAALGCCIARGKDRVICIDGDGSLMMNLQELQTIHYNNCNMKLFVLNNNGYHSIRQTQNNLFKDGLIGVCDGNGVNFPPFDKLADTFGFTYFKIDSLDGIEAKLEEVLNADGPVLCEAVLDETQYFAPKLSSKVLPSGKIVSPPLDDMFPFLDRDEYEANKLQ